MRFNSRPGRLYGGISKSGARWLDKGVFIPEPDEVAQLFIRPGTLVPG